MMRKIIELINLVLTQQIYRERLAQWNCMIKYFIFLEISVIRLTDYKDQKVWFYLKLMCGCIHNNVVADLMLRFV